MDKKEQLQHYLNEKVQFLIGNKTQSPTLVKDDEIAAMHRKKKSERDRKSQIVKTNVKVTLKEPNLAEEMDVWKYRLVCSHLIKHYDTFYMEEETEERQAVFQGNQLIDDYKLGTYEVSQEKPPTIDVLGDRDGREYRYEYDRRAAVQYAEEWWNDYNPKYKVFDVDCTNYVSQCLHAGGAPMTGYPQRSKGWWFRNEEWSYSWAVAHSFRWYLSGSERGLQAKEVERATNLELGDVICYDFEGDGRWDHTTIVVGFDGNKEPLVNAHTSNSRMRYWKYEDSTAWTPNIKYKFFHIQSKG